MIVEWHRIGEHRDQRPATKAQRRALYRLGLDHGFVHRHVRTQADVNVAIEVMAALNTRLRGQNQDIDRRGLARPQAP